MFVVAVDFYIFKFCCKGGMTAVVRPVSVYNLYFRFSGISLLTLEIIRTKARSCTDIASPIFA